MECISINCTNEPKAGSTFCPACLNGLLEHELHIDDLVPGLENAIEPTWERIKNEKRRNKQKSFKNRRTEIIQKN